MANQETSGGLLRTLLCVDGQMRTRTLIPTWNFLFPLGAVRKVDEDTESQWKTILFLSTLHHLEALLTDEKLAVIRTALSNALNVSVNSGLALGWTFVADIFGAIKTDALKCPASI